MLLDCSKTGHLIINHIFHSASYFSKTQQKLALLDDMFWCFLRCIKLCLTPFSFIKNKCWWGKKQLFNY